MIARDVVPVVMFKISPSYHPDIRDRTNTIRGGDGLVGRIFNSRSSLLVSGSD